MTLEGLSNVCTKLEPASSKNNEILDINVPQKINLHVLCISLGLLLHMCNLKDEL